MNKSYIIRKAEDFNLIINNGKRIKGNIISIYYYPSTDEKKYFGFAVGKKNGNAVERNRIKRKIRMLVHEHQNLFSNKYKYIIMLKRDCLSYPHSKWNEDILNIIGKVQNNEKN